MKTVEEIRKEIQTEQKLQNLEVRIERLEDLMDCQIKINSQNVNVFEKFAEIFKPEVIWKHEIY
jgi:hypothetical protein